MEVYLHGLYLSDLHPPKSQMNAQYIDLALTLFSMQPDIKADDVHTCRMYPCIDYCGSRVPVGGRGIHLIVITCSWNFLLIKPSGL